MLFQVNHCCLGHGLCVNAGHRKAFEELKYRTFMAVGFALEGLSIATDMPMRKILNQIGLASLGMHDGHSN